MPKEIYVFLVHFKGFCKNFVFLQIYKFLLFLMKPIGVVAKILLVISAIKIMVT